MYFVKDADMQKVFSIIFANIRQYKLDIKKTNKYYFFPHNKDSSKIPYLPAVWTYVKTFVVFLDPSLIENCIKTIKNLQETSVIAYHTPDSKYVRIVRVGIMSLSALW